MRVDTEGERGRERRLGNRGNGVNIFSIKRRERNGKLRGGEGKNRNLLNLTGKEANNYTY